MIRAKTRQAIGNIRGFDGRLDAHKAPFFQIKVALPAVSELERVLTTLSGARQGISITTDFHDPNRLRISRVEPPDFEAKAASHYVRGNTLRVSGRPGNSCNLDLSGRFGVPALLQELKQARQKAQQYILLQVQSRRDLLEIIPDTDWDDVLLARAGASLAAHTWTSDDFADWEK